MKKNIFIDMASLHEAFNYNEHYFIYPNLNNYTKLRKILLNFINILHGNNVNIYLFIDSKYAYRDRIFELANLKDLHIKDVFIINSNEDNYHVFKSITGKHLGKSIIAYRYQLHVNRIRTCEFGTSKYALLDNTYNSILKICKYLKIKCSKEMLDMEFKYATREDSLKEYRKYVENHINNVIKAHQKYKTILNSYADLRAAGDLSHLSIDIDKHDESKYSDEEFYAYAAKFYTSMEDDLTKIRANFDVAWEHHYTHNKHHPEYWVCKSKLTGKNIITRMDNASFVEMLCDWIAMSMNFKQSLHDWWFNNNGGRGEKSKLLTVEDINLIDKIIIDNKDVFDFRN